MSGAGVIVVAAGAGTRFDAIRSKAFVELDQRPLVVHSLELFEDMREVDEIVVVLREEDVMRYLSDVAERFTIRKVARVIPGGERRQDSVRLGLAALGPARVVLVHDAARPLVEADLVRRCLTALDAETAGVVPTVPVVDTLKRIEGESVRETVDRTKLACVQTPQAFQRAALETAHRRAAEEGFETTDDAALIERYGGVVRRVDGDPANIKITIPLDLVLAEAVLAARRGAAVRSPER